MANRKTNKKLTTAAITQYFTEGACFLPTVFDHKLQEAVARIWIQNGAEFQTMVQKQRKSRALVWYALQEAINQCILWTLNDVREANPIKLSMTAYDLQYLKRLSTESLQGVVFYCSTEQVVSAFADLGVDVYAMCAPHIVALDGARDIFRDTWRQSQRG